MQRRHILLGLAGLPLISSCDYLHNRSDLDWTEDVLLPDGRVITLKRHQEFKGSYEIGDTPNPSNYWLEFSHPDTRERIRWEQNDGSANLWTLWLTINKDKVMLLTAPMFGSSYESNNYPYPPYILFQYKNGRWEKESLEKITPKRIRNNLTWNPKESRLRIEKLHYHLDKKETSDSYYQEDIYQHNRPFWVNFDGVDRQVFGWDSRKIQNRKDFIEHALPKKIIDIGEKNGKF